ncbi:tyrosine-type recombinase/integrase [Magnetococcus sp. PR-3]|uniref:tyrosine-type recombinase/integrase n=1 Tax=Magnetococcus sp. PR-3 TaxID=3120355 RepID=UPI003FA5342D
MVLFVAPCPPLTPRSSKVTPHMLRHTFGRLCVDANVNLCMIQQMMGHSDIRTTQIYTHVSTKAMRENFSEVVLF